MAAPGNVEHKLKLLFDTQLDTKSKEQVGRQIKGMLENAVISFDEAEAKKNLKSIITTLNRLFDKAELEGFDTDELLKMPSQKALQEIASLTADQFQDAFERALQKSGGVKIDFGNVDISSIVEPLERVTQELSDISQKVADTTKKSVHDIETSLNTLKSKTKIKSTTKNIDNLFKTINKGNFKGLDTVQSAINELSILRDQQLKSVENGDAWEEQYQYLVKYVHTYEAAQKKFGEGFTAKNFELQDLYSNLSPKAKSARISLEDFANIAKGGELTEDKHKPWAREKTLKNVEEILKNGITVNGNKDSGSDGDGGSSGNKNSPPKTASNSKSKGKRTPNIMDLAIKNFIKDYTTRLDKIGDGPDAKSQIDALRELMFDKLYKQFEFFELDEDKMMSYLGDFAKDRNQKDLSNYLNAQIDKVKPDVEKKLIEAIKANTKASEQNEKSDKTKSASDKQSADSDKQPSNTVTIDKASLKEVLEDVTYKVKIEGEKAKDALEDNQVVEALGNISEKIDNVSKDETLREIKGVIDAALTPKSTQPEGKIPPEVKAETSSNREQRFERLNDIASFYEDVEDVEAAIKEFGELYKEIILIGDEANKTIKPNKTGINTLKKIASDDLDFDYSWVEFRRANPVTGAEAPAPKTTTVAINEESLRDVLSGIVYNVKIEGEEKKDDAEDNKVVLDADTLKSVLDHTYSVKIIQDADAPDSEKASLFNAEELKTILDNTYNVKIAHDDADKASNEITLNESALEGVLDKVFGNIVHPKTPQNDGDAKEPRAPWALEDTLGKVEGILKEVRDKYINTGTEEKQQAVVIDDKSVSAISSDLTAIKKAVEAINDKTVKGATSSTQSGGKSKGETAKKNSTVKTTSDESLNIRTDEAYYAERAKLAEKAAKEEAAIQKKTRAKAIKEQLKDQEKALKQQIKANEEEARMSKTRGIRGRAIDSITSVNLLDDLSENAKKGATSDLIDKISEFDALRTRIQSGDSTITPDDIDQFKRLQVEIDKASKELNEFASIHNLVANKNADAIAITTPFDPKNMESYRQALEGAIQTHYRGKAIIGDFDYKTGQLNYTVKTGRHEVTEYKATWDKLGGTFAGIPGKVKPVEGVLKRILNKAKEFGAYFTGSSMIYKAWNAILQGITYIREIDSALTDLKKVTDETEESYERFLDTAAKTADKVGSTIKEIVSSTADWARIGYSLKEAAALAESTAILLNVSEFSNIEDATSALTSTLQAFGYTAEQSMDVVDVLNEVKVTCLLIQ